MTATNCCHVSVDGWLLLTLTWLTLILLMAASLRSCSTSCRCCWSCCSFLSWGNIGCCLQWRNVKWVTHGDYPNVTFVMCVVSSMSDSGGVDARLVGWKLMKKRVLREKWRAGPWRHAACLPPRILAGLDPCTEHRDGHRAEHLWNEEPAPLIFFLTLQKRQAETWRFFIQK